MNTSEQINELTAALVLAHMEIGTIPMSGENPHFRSKFATAADIYLAVNLPLSKHGLVMIQGAHFFNNERVVVESRLLHKSGQWIESALSLKPKDDSPQSIGSAISYARRYLISAMLSIAAEEEDDGEAAQGRTTEKEKALQKVNDEYQNKVIDLQQKIIALQKQNEALSGQLAKLKPKEIFDIKNVEHIERLEKILAAKQICETEWGAICDAMVGKEMIPRIVNEICEGLKKGDGEGSGE